MKSAAGYNQSANFATAALANRWQPWLVVVALVLAACSSDATRDATTIPLPTGHYEGPISYLGTEVRVALDLREVTPGQLQADVSFPTMPGLEFAAAQLRYQEPQLRIEQHAHANGGISIQAVREGDFLRGVLTWDSLRTDFVWVRRGDAASRGYREQSVRLGLPGYSQPLAILFPDDTLAKHPAIALVPPLAATARATTQAARLARQGYVTVVVPVTAPSPVAAGTDSVATQVASAALTLLRTQTGVDSSRVGIWGSGVASSAVALAAATSQPQAAFVVLEAAPATTAAEARQYRVLGEQHLSTLGIYAALDTSVNVQESSRRLRTALGNKGAMQVRTIPQVSSTFVLPGRASEDGQWQWPRPAPNYWEGVLAWLKSVNQ
ncbi:hypothetical protein [Hymenobacter mucosus]|uniref:Dienelactone hydrolase n=1 Tax=Hymenobacter mucosus TaxID=1411120 RepID=A0A238WGW7_9BACT|nr:hypothetical protein [Hymenobacter mucosus]SNR45832.1 Dienelactone hydrolase [Hymenobacter mucosus]